MGSHSVPQRVAASALSVAMMISGLTVAGIAATSASAAPGANAVQDESFTVRGDDILAAADDSTAVSDAGKTTISVGDTWYDTDGNPIEAHGASANLYHESEVGIDINGDGDTNDDIYLLYGENKTHATRPVDGINGYWSEDLVTWHNMGNVLPTHQILPYKSVTVTSDDDYTDVDSTRPAVGSKYAVFDENQYARLKTLANLSQTEAKAQGVEQAAASARAFVKAYVTEWNAAGNAIAYDEEHLRLAFQYLDGDFNVVERPMNVYNPKTKKFMIIFHSDSPTNANTKLNSWIDACRSDAQFAKDGTCNTEAIGNMLASRYGRAQVGFAQSDTPFGPFTLINSTRMNYDTGLNATRLGESRGMNLFVDDVDSNNDGVSDVYAVYASEMNEYMYVSRLNSTYTGPETEGDAVKPGENSTWNARILPERKLEASPVFKWNGEYYMFSKGTNGWGDATVYLFRSKSMLQSQWEKIGNPFIGDMAESAYKSEPNHIIAKDAAKGEFIYTGERWVVDPTTGSAGKDSKMIWLPIVLTGDDSAPVQIEGRTSWNPNDDTVYRPTQDLGNWTMGTTLPSTLDIGSASVAVTWDEGSVNAANAAEEFSSVRLTGALADGSRVSALVRAIPANLRYLIDSGNTSGDANTSELYGSVKKNVDLLNAVADQEWDGSGSGKTWGYSTQAGVATGFNDAAEWQDSYVGANFNKPVTYHLTLPAGTYTIGTVQAPRSGQTKIYSTVRLGEQTISERKEAVSDGSATRIVQEVTVPVSTDGKESVVDVEFGTNATKGYNARLALLWVRSVADKTGLQAAVDEAGKLVESDYTADSWEVFASALRNANTVLVDDQATQESVDDAVRRLAEAREALKPAEQPAPVDKTDLQAAVDAAGELVESDYTAESWEAFASALRNASTVLADDKAAQADVDRALWKLVEARDALKPAEQPAQVDKSRLQALVDAYRGLDGSGYTDDSWARFKAAYADAEDVLADGSASQDRVDRAARALRDAWIGLQFRPSEPSGPSYPSGPSVSYVTVRFDSQGGSAVADRVVVSGTTVEAPAAPVRDGYAFYRWTTDEAGLEPYDFGTPVTGSLTLYAQWKVPVYRLYNPYMAQGASHLYTVDKQEYDYLKTQGWNQEGVAFLTDSKDAQGVKPVYRLYNRYDGSHHYTLDPEEYEYLRTQGWTQEGEAWYASDTQGSDVYRLYNRYTGEHLWTTSQGEYDFLESQGWTKEGVAFKAYLA